MTAPDWTAPYLGQPFDPASERGLAIILEGMGDTDPDTIAAFLHDETSVCIKNGERYLNGDIRFTDDGPRYDYEYGGFSYADSWKERAGR